MASGPAAVVEERRVASPVVRGAERVDIGRSVADKDELDDRSRREDKSFVSRWMASVHRCLSQWYSRERRLILIHDECQLAPRKSSIRL